MTDTSTVVTSNTRFIIRPEPKIKIKLKKNNVQITNKSAHNSN